MELSARETLNNASKLIGKSNALIEEIRTIETRKQSLQSQLAVRATGAGQTATRPEKEIIGLEKALESMREKLEKNIGELGGHMENLKSAYRQRAEQGRIGRIAEAVPE